MTDTDKKVPFIDKRRTEVDESDDLDVSDNDEETTAVDEALSGDGSDAETEQGAPDVYSIVQYSLQMLISSAWYKLGLLADPSTGEVATDLVQAKFAIDVVGDIAVRLEMANHSSMPPEAIKELKRVVNDLRLNYVSKQTGK